MRVDRFKMLTKLHKIICSVMLLVSMAFVSGCGGDVYSDVYTDVMQEVANEKVYAQGMTWSELIVAKCINFYLEARRIAPIVMIGSFLFGAVVYLLIRKFKPIRRMAVFVFMLGIPALTFITVYGLAFLIGMFQ